MQPSVDVNDRFALAREFVRIRGGQAASIGQLA
jgi:hypothetical protein